MFFFGHSPKSKDKLNKLNKREEEKEKQQKRKKDDGWGEGWGSYMREKNRKLGEQFQGLNKNNTEEGRSCIFKGVCIFVNGYTNPSSDHLKQMMADHGGNFQHYYSKRVCTHIVATNLPDSKIKELKNEKVVHPDWILDSINAGRCLPVGKYLLYNGTRAKQEEMFTSFVQDSADQRLKKQPDFLNGPNHTEDESKNGLGVGKEAELNITGFNGSQDGMSDSLFDLSNSPRREETSSEAAPSNPGPSKFETHADVTAPTLSKHDYDNNVHSKPCSKAGDPGFMNDFYSNSRLHHLSMWKSELKRYASMIASSAKKQNNRGISQSERCIMHIDMDSFFVSVTLKERPDLKGKPVAVCHASKGTNTAGVSSMSEIASCSYEARDKGVRNGMFLGQAKGLCPEIICVPYKFESYRVVSQQFYEVLASYTSDIEAVSCDEALLDISDLVAEDLTALDVARRIRESIYELTGCKASAGIASNILMARMATRKAKPNGQFHLARDDVKEFIGPQKVTDLPGVGRSLASKLKEMGATTCADLRLISLPKLQEKFGPKTGLTLHKHCRGLDDRIIKTEHERQSVSAEINYGIRFVEDREAFSFINELAKEVEDRLKAIQMKGTHIALKIMVRKSNAPEPLKHMGHGVCDNVSKSTTVLNATDDRSVIAKECTTLLKNLKIAPCDIRGMGIQVSKLARADSIAKGVKTIDFSNCIKARPMEAVTSGLMSVRSDTNSSSPSKKSFKGCGSSDVNLNRPLKARTNKRTSPRKMDKRHNKNTTATIESCMKSNAVKYVAFRPDLEAKSPAAEPPLPSLFSSPDKPIVCSRPVQFDLPSPSQVDPTVFNALPDDVRRSITESYRAKNQTLKVGSNTERKSEDTDIKMRWNPDPYETVPLTDDTGFLEPGFGKPRNSKEIGDKPTASALFYNDVACNEMKGSRACDGLDSARIACSSAVGIAEEALNVNHLSLSQIDPEVMKELPEKLRKEILQNIRFEERRKKRENQKKQMNIQQETVSPKKKKSGSCRNEALRKEQCYGENEESSVRNADDQNCHAEENCIDPCVNDERTFVNEGNTRSRMMHRPMLCGKNDYNDVKVLIKSWIESSEEPLIEDIEEITRYIEDLISYRNMEKAFLLMKYIQRSAKDSLVWKNVVNGIALRVQQLMQDLYCGKFPLASLE